MMKRLLIAAIVLAVLISGATWLTAQSPTPTPLPDNDQIAEAYVVEPANLELTVSVRGSVAPLREARLTFNAVDVVGVVNAAEEQLVRAGDVLAQLDMADVDILVRDAESTLANQQLRLRDLETPERDIDLAVVEAAKDTAQAQANAAIDDAPSDEDVRVAQLQIELARNQLWQQQLGRDARLDINPEFRESDTNDAESEETQMNSAIAGADTNIVIQETEFIDVTNTGYNLTALGAANSAIVAANNLLDDLSGPADARDLNIAAISVASAEIAVNLQREYYDDRTIVAPFDGLITENNLTVGELTPGGTAITLMDISQYIVRLDADEVEVANLQLGQPTTVTFDALPDVELPGTITYIAPINTGGSDVPIYSVEVTLDPTDAPIRIDMSADAAIEVAKLTDVITVPTSFINQRGIAGVTVFVLEDNSRIVEVPVVLGLSSDDYTQIMSGLDAGQTIVRLKANF